MKYRNPALVEIFVRLALPPGAISESQILDFAQPLGNLGLSDREIVNAAQSEAARPVVISPRVRFWDFDRKRLVQIARDAVVINNVAPYIGWDDFSSFIAKVLATLEEHGLPSTFRSVELTTLDKFRVDLKGYKFGDWLKADGQYIPALYADTNEQCDIQFGLGVVSINGFNRQLHIHVHTVNDTMEFQIRCIFDRATDDSVQLTDVLQVAHDEALEPPRVLRRLQHLREWSYEQVKQVFP